MKKIRTKNLKSYGVHGLQVKRYLDACTFVFHYYCDSYSTCLSQQLIFSVTQLYYYRQEVSTKMETCSILKWLATSSQHWMPRRTVSEWEMFVCPPMQWHIHVHVQMHSVCVQLHNRLRLSTVLYTIAFNYVHHRGNAAKSPEDQNAIFND